MKERLLKILGILLIIIMAFLLLGIVKYHTKTEKENREKITQFEEKTEPYEAEIKRIKEELKTKEANIAQKSEKGLLMVAYQIEKPEDMSIISKEKKKFNLSPILVLDITQKNVFELLKKIENESYEVVLTGIPDNGDMNKQVQTIKQNLKKTKLIDSNFFLIRDADDTTEKLKNIEKMGFKGCIRYNNHVTNNVMNNGYLYMGYSFIRNNRLDIHEKMDKAVSTKMPLMFVFDMKSVSEGILSEEQMEKDIKEIQQQVEKEVLEINSVQNIAKKLSQMDAKEDKQRIEFEQYEEKQKKRIDELQKELDKIYEEWN